MNRPRTKTVSLRQAGQGGATEAQTPRESAQLPPPSIATEAAPIAISRSQSIASLVEELSSRSRHYEGLFLKIAGELRQGAAELGLPDWAPSILIAEAVVLRRRVSDLERRIDNANKWLKQSGSMPMFGSEF